RGGRVVPCTCKSLPSAVASTPSARRLAAINSSRLLSFTRSSPTSRNTVSPAARLARTARIGTSSTRVGTSAAATSVPRSAAAGGRTIRSATGSPPSSRRLTRSACAPIRSSTTRNPVRVGFTPTFSTRSSPPSASTPAGDRERQRVAVRVIDAGTHGPQGLGDAPHRPAPQRGVAGERGREPLAGEDAEDEARGGAGVPAMQPGNGTRETGHVDLDGGVLPNGGDRRAQTTQDARAGLDVLARQEPRDLAGPARQRGEHEGAVGDALVTGRPDGAAHLHASSLRRHSAPRRSQAVNPAPSPARVGVT